MLFYENNTLLFKIMNLKNVKVKLFTKLLVYQWLFLQKYFSTCLYNLQSPFHFHHARFGLQQGKFWQHKLFQLLHAIWPVMD